METDTFPTASTRQRRRWLLPLLVFITLISSALGLLFYHFSHQNDVRLKLHFQQGYGLKIGDPLRYRGITIGEVKAIQLDPDLSGISVEIYLSKTAADIATEHSQFWIVRPQLNLTGAEGLETVIGANYVNVLPGKINHADDPTHLSFTGLEQPPALAILEAGGLSVDLLTQSRGSLKVNAPVFYREIKVGTILSVDLTPDSSSVRARVYIQPAYTGLIREGTRFWKTSGFQLGLGWSGLSMNVDSLQGLLLGGVTLAVPPAAGQLAEYGQQFELAEEPEKAWLEWRAYTPLNVAQLPDLPTMQLANLTWQERNLLQLTSDEQQQAWVLPVAQGFLGTKAVFNPPQDALAGSAELHIADQLMTVTTPAQTMTDELALLPYQHQFSVWNKQRAATQPENTLIVAAPDQSPLYIEAYHYQADNTLQWQLDKQVSIPETWNGAAVLSERDGALLGVLLLEGRRAHVALLPALPD